MARAPTFLTAILAGLAASPRSDAADRMLRGDANQDGAVDLSDGVAVLLYLFADGQTPHCLDAADADDTGTIDLSDAIYILNNLFLGGRALPAPFPACGVDPTADVLGCQDSRCPQPKPLPPVPLHTQSRWVIGADGQRFKFAAVNWYGAEEKDYVVAGLEKQPLEAIAARIRDLGFNAVRLPWSNELVKQNPVVKDAVVSANPGLRGKHVLEVFDLVIDALALEGLVIILDNHTSDAGWCCSNDDQNGLWYNARFSEATWIAHWKLMAGRYLLQPAVVAADLRNEPRNGVRWGGNDPGLDWKRAARAAGNAVLEVNPDLLIVVEGLEYSSDLGGVYSDPLSLDLPHRLVYSPHDYSWFHNGLSSYEDLKSALGDRWGFILVQGKAFTAPILVTEFGTCNTSASCVKDVQGGGFWFAGFRRYLSEADIDWCYWALNGTQARAPGRVYGAAETFGILGTSWISVASQKLLEALQELQPIHQRP